MVTNWFPTDKKPKICILRLNKQEWMVVYSVKKSKIEIENNLEKFLREHLKPEFDTKEKKEQAIQGLMSLLNSISKTEAEKLLKQISPHRGFNYEEKTIMEETSGICLDSSEQKILGKTNTFLDSYFEEYDYVIVLSDFPANERQKQAFKKKRTYEMWLYETIFHELIHVIEKCNNITIFKTDNPDENLKITMPMIRKWFEN